MPKEYLLDANIFITAYRSLYPLDVVPSFWAKIKILAERGVIRSIDKVRDELYRHEDELCDWCKAQLPSEFWHASEENVTEYIQLVQWAATQTQRYRQHAIDEFLEGDNADAFLIARAFADRQDRIIVTYETSSQTTKRIKIPDVCLEFRIRTIQPIEMLRELNETL